jgi:hypothetical protein
MAGLVPAIRVLPAIHRAMKRKSWMPGIKPGMTHLSGVYVRRSGTAIC